MTTFAFALLQPFRRRRSTGRLERCPCGRRPIPSPVRIRPSATGLVLVLLLAVVVGSTSAASAHTDLLQGSPGPGQQVGGTVDFVDLVFVDPVANAAVTIEGPDGQELGGTTVVTDGQIIRYEMAPLTEVGRYVTRYSMISADGDFTESGFFFVYEPSAIEPIRLGDADIPSSGWSPVAIAASVVFGLAMIGLVLVFLAKLERDRAAAAAVGDG